MKTLIATLILLGFCLPTMAIAEDRVVRGQEAEDLLLKGDIIDRNITGDVFYYLVELKDDVWICQFTNYSSGATWFWCRTAN